MRNSGLFIAVVLVMVAIVYVGLLTLNQSRTPFEKILFKKEFPGAGDRHVVYTPVLLADPSKIIGESVGADFGEISYRDCDGDGVNEAVIETDKLFDMGEYSASVRHVYKYVPGLENEPEVDLISTEYMPEKDPQWIREKVANIKIDRYCE